jgi:hypothetical protein
MMENHSCDNHLGMLGRAGADGAPGHEGVDQAMSSSCTAVSTNALSPGLSTAPMLPISIFGMVLSRLSVAW